jgi:predicted negative regulator of RcsB-dependent stress response
MSAAILAWIADQGVGLVLGALAKLVLDGWNSYQANQALKRAGAAETAAKTNAETVETKDAMDDVARPSDDAVADSLRTGKF